MISLKVPFHEKDEAKTLGAKWNPQNKCWYITASDDIGLFSRWIPELINPSNKGVNLSDLLFKVKSVINDNLNDKYWVKAEISNISNNVHLYVDLVEYDDNKNEIAKVRAAIWSKDRDYLENKFFSKTSEKISPGMSVLIEVFVDFHPQYGISLTISDIDPSYTVGAIQSKINEILSRLDAEGIYHNNKNLFPPQEFTNIAVIAPETAAGLGDFKAEADILSSSGLCNFSYYSAVFQGTQSLSSINQAFINVHTDMKINSSKFDAIIMIRGGGSKTDLHFVNEFQIAKAIALSEVPVFVGIGHERDLGVPDMICNTSFDTPSKVISHIQSVIISNAMDADHNFKYIFDNLKHTVQLSQKSVQNMFHEVHLNSTNSAINSELRLNNNLSKLNLSANRMISTSEEFINNEFHTIIQSAHSHVNINQLKVEATIKSVLQNNPISILTRGFAVVKKDNAYISSTSNINTNDVLTIKLQDGDISTTVN